MKYLNFTTQRAIFLMVLVTGLVITSCKDSTTSAIQPDSEEMGAISLDMTAASTTTTNVFTSDGTELSWGPIEYTGSRWQNECTIDGSIGLEAFENLASGPTYAFARTAATFGNNYTDASFDANWINAWNNIRSNGHAGTFDKHWTKYSKTISGDAGNYVMQYVADNCSWVYINGVQTDYQGESKLPAEVSVSLPGGPVELSFIILDGGGQAGGIYRLETYESYKERTKTDPEEKFGGNTTPIVIPPTEPENNAPVADAGTYETTEATGSTTSVTLDGSASYDDDEGDVLTYAWAVNGSTVSGETAEVALPVGTHTISLTVTDQDGASDTATSTVTVEDTTDPVLTYSQETNSLWPPNHKMVLVATGISANDLVDGNTDVTVTVNSSQDANGKGDGNTDADYYEIVDNFGTLSVYVRAERSGKNGERTYTISMTAEDAAGNDVTESFDVSVAKSQGKGGKAK